MSDKVKELIFSLVFTLGLFCIVYIIYDFTRFRGQAESMQDVFIQYKKSLKNEP